MSIMPLKFLSVAAASSMLLMQVATTPAPPTEVSGMITLVNQLKDLGLVGFLIAVVLAQYRDKRAMEARKDEQILAQTKQLMEQAAINALSTVAITHNTDSNRDLTSSIKSLQETILRQSSSAH